MCLFVLICSVFRCSMQVGVCGIRLNWFLDNCARIDKRIVSHVLRSSVTRSWSIVDIGELIAVLIQKKINKDFLYNFFQNLQMQSLEFWVTWVSSCSLNVSNFPVLRQSVRPTVAIRRMRKQRRKYIRTSEQWQPS